ncbi:EAL domain-containing protein [Butyrivibrio proteoclasticus]|uniref:bifunctional diguanylate cyclase/phosphodiesterase n=1 Tax=Butyrivibrio proteoclasticus TaxID=43305 RepID=UPI00047AD262|nr:EAL domain-containing protein [Butyrivibrio proteoclasticus]
MKDATKEIDKAAVAKYVVENIDKAIENGWIVPYYQPVIRSLTGQLCSAEALARWIDPEYGFLAPYLFIGPLEDSKQIYKLDCFIVECACKDISDRLSQELPVVPVSINLSRLDFEATNMLEVVEKAIEKYDIPRDYLHVEITESMIASDEDLMRSEIDRFREAGYEVWMDDFGSGYSSLTVLKDFQFDTLKMDMHFLSTFTEKSKSIMTWGITMAKSIKMKTLAEGVETQEQVDFLKKIGCGRLQGYFYGKPMPLDDLLPAMQEKNITFEKRQWRHYYDVASFNAMETNEPLELFEYDGKNFKTLFMNEPYKQQIFINEKDLSKIDNIIYTGSSPLVKKYKEFANILASSGNQETFYYTYNGSILRFTARVLASNAGRHLIKGSILNISMDRENNKLNDLNYRLKELNHLFEVVLQLNPGNNSIAPLLGQFRYSPQEKVVTGTLTERNELTEKYIVHPKDRKRYHDFLDMSTIKSRIELSGRGYVVTVCRLKQPDGNYQWKELSLLLIPGTNAREYLLCIKSTVEDVYKYIQESVKGTSYEASGEVSDEIIRSAYMWQNVINSSNIKFFWKDKDRRFIGVSQSFLDFYDIRSLDDIIGKTDEDIRWNVDENSYMSDEIDVVTKGKLIQNAPGQCIVNGIVHNIVANKVPFYINNEIAGLLGYFIDCDEELNQMDSASNKRRIDPVTGLMSTKAFTDAMIDYALEYHENHKNYGLIIIRNSKYERIRETFGDEFGKKLLKEMGNAIVKVTGQSCAVARTREADFALITYLFKPGELQNICENVKESVESIRMIDGNDVTVKLETACVVRSECDLPDEGIYQMAMNQLK